MTNGSVGCCSISGSGLLIFKQPLTQHYLVGICQLVTYVVSASMGVDCFGFNYLGTPNEKKKLKNMGPISKKASSWATAQAVAPSDVVNSCPIVLLKGLGCGFTQLSSFQWAPTESAKKGNSRDPLL